MLQVLYLIQSTKQQNYDIDVQDFKAFSVEFVQLKLPANNVIENTYLEILLEILLMLVAESFDINWDQSKLKPCFHFSDQFHPMESSFLNQLIEVRDSFVRKFTEFKQYDQLTQSYIQKTFTLFNLLLSVNLETDENQLPVLSHSVFETQNEVIETQLNIKYLLLCQQLQKPTVAYDYSHYEIELVKFFERNHSNKQTIQQLLLSTRDLYHMIEHKLGFYPYGVIKAYEILSFLISPPDAFENNPELLRLTFEQLLELMAAINDDDEVDDVTESIWKFITAHLKHYRIDPSCVTSDQMGNIISNLRYSTLPFKSSTLRQTVTEAFSIIIQYFVKCTNLELITDIAELLLTLLRDDDIYVRDRISEIVMELIRNDNHNDNTHKGNSIDCSLVNKYINSYVLYSFSYPVSC